MVFGIKSKMIKKNNQQSKIDYFDPDNVFLAIATNIPVLKTGFVLQGHISYHVMAGHRSLCLILSL